MKTTNHQIVITESERFSLNAVQLLQEISDVIVGDFDYKMLLESISDATAIWVRLRHYIGSEVMDAAPELRYVITATTGLNHIDLEEAERRGISVISLRGETDFLKEIRATAELTICLMLALMRKIPQALSHVRDGGWNRDLFVGSELHRKTIGVIGYGRLGRIVAHYLRAFDAEVLATDPVVLQEDAEDDVQLVQLEELLSRCDIVTLHVDYSSENRGMFGASEFTQMKPGSWFINTARGELIDESALIDALSSGRLSGAALDVMDNENEVMNDRRLITYARNHDNLIITPHIGGCTWESTEKTEDFLASRIVRLLKEES